MYLGHKGERIQGRRWEDLVSQDFRDLREHGLGRPQMAGIERALAGAAGGEKVQDSQGAMTARDAAAQRLLQCNDGCSAVFITCRFSNTGPVYIDDGCLRLEKTCLANCQTISRIP